MCDEDPERHHGDSEVVSRRVEGDIHRYTWADVARRARQVANAVESLGLAMGDRVATLAWNGYRHLELYFGVPGVGATLHPVNVRLSPEHIVYTIRHAQDRVLFFDDALLPRGWARDVRLTLEDGRIAAIEEGVPAPVITASLLERFESRLTLTPAPATAMM